MMERRQQPLGMGLLVLALVLVLVLLPAHVPVARAVTIEVPPKGKVCMYQYYEAGDSGRAEVFVVNGGNLDIRLTVEGPFKDDAEGAPRKETQETRVVYDEVVSSSSSFTNREDHPPGVLATADGLELSWAARAGAYAVCLDNGMSQVQTKVVEFSLPSPEKEGEEDFDLEGAYACGVGVWWSGLDWHLGGSQCVPWSWVGSCSDPNPPSSYHSGHRGGRGGGGRGGRGRG